MTEQERLIQQAKPLDDFMFSKLFEKKESAPLAKALINAVLENAGKPLIDTIDDVQCQKVYLGEHRLARGVRLDVAAVSGGKYINVEVQLNELKYMVERMLLNATKQIVTHMPKGKAELEATGEVESDTKAVSEDAAKVEAYDEDYANVPKITVITIYDAVQRKDDKDFHQSIGLYYENGERRRASEVIDFHTLELPKFRKLKPDFSMPLHRWLWYLDNANKLEKSNTIKEIIDMDATIRDYNSGFQLLTKDPKTQMDFFDQMLLRMDDKAYIDSVGDRREAKGRAEERRNTLHDVIVRLASHGSDKFQVAIATGLSMSELEREIIALKPRIDAERKKLEDERAERFGNTPSGSSRK